MKLNHTEALNKIDKISKKNSPLVVIKKELMDVLSATDEKSYKQLLDWVVSSYDKATWYVQKRNLQFVSPLINEYINWDIGKKHKQKEDNKDNEDNNFGAVSLVREKDKEWKYKVYKYTVKKWGKPKNIINKYIRQIWWSRDGIIITDEKWKEYPDNKMFSSWDTVYIKVPISLIETMDEDTKEKIKIQEEYIENQDVSYKNLLEKFNKQHPMWKDVEMSFGIPVYRYEDIEKTLASITTNQKMDPKRYEVVLLLNRPSTEVDFDNETKEKILKFKLNNPGYNIHIFEHTFDFKKDKNGKYIVNYWKLYKTLWDTIVYRNIQRNKIKWMDMKKIRNLIVKTWAADSTDKNPKYIENQLEKYGNDYSGKELVNLRWESRLPAKICKAYPLVEILEFFQRRFDAEYAGWPLNRNVWIWSYKSWMYCDAKWFRWTWQEQWEDVALVKDIKKSIKKRNSEVTMYYDKDFVWAVDESCDRWIRAMVEKNRPYCDRYIDQEWNTASKEKDWNKYAIDHKWSEKFRVLELTKQNLEKNLSGFYRQRINNIFEWKTHSTKYHGERDSKLNHVPWTWYLDNEWKSATKQERAEWIANNVVNPIMENVLSQNDFMWLSKWDYEFWEITLEKYYNRKEKKYKDRVKSVQIKFNESAITKIMEVQKKKIASWYYDYRK